MQIDWWTLGIQTINFLIVVWLLSRFLYRPVRRVIEAREAAARKVQNAAEEAEKAAEAARQGYEAKRAELAARERERETELHKAMEAERDKVMEAAHKEASDLIANARTRIERERAEAVDDLHAQIADLARDLAAKALAGRTWTAEADIRAAIGHLQSVGESELAELRGDLAGEGEPLTVVSAAALADPDRDAWRAALAPFVGDGAAIAFEADPDLLGGVRLRFPHAAVDFSVAGRLAQAAQRMKG